MSVAKVELGRRLFYEKRLSINGKMACASCHQQARAFTDGRKTARGTTGEDHPRNSPTLGNVAYAPVLTWAHPTLVRLEDQLLIPLLGVEPIEMGRQGKERKILDVLKNDKIYRAGFSNVFGGPQSVSLQNMAKALASFQRQLITANSDYDRGVLTKSAKRGKALFFSEKLNCFRCHQAPYFSDSVTHVDLGFKEIAFHNTGLYDLDGEGAYPPINTGLHGHTGKAQDMGRFRTPSLRNVAVTSPYMHDGSVKTLSEVLDIYAAGGRGTGRHNPFKSVFVSGFEITPVQKKDLLAFLDALTDESFLTNPRFSNPFK